MYFILPWHWTPISHHPRIEDLRIQYLLFYLDLYNSQSAKKDWSVFVMRNMFNVRYCSEALIKIHSEQHCSLGPTTDSSVSVLIAGRFVSKIAILLFSNWIRSLCGIRCFKVRIINYCILKKRIINCWKEL